jgi:uncharacterized protein (TIGR02594 family)
MKLLTVILAALALAWASPSLARGHHRHHGHHHHHRHAHHARIGHPMELPGGALLEAARRYEGLRHSPDGFRGQWCGSFLGAVARRVGKPVPRDFRLARAWARVGRPSAARVGAVVVFRHHVTLLVRIVPGGFIGLGGNQGHRVRESRFSWRGVIAIRSV